MSVGEKTYSHALSVYRTLNKQRTFAPSPQFIKRTAVKRNQFNRAATSANDPHPDDFVVNVPIKESLDILSGALGRVATPKRPVRHDLVWLLELSSLSDASQFTNALTRENWHNRVLKGILQSPCLLIVNRVTCVHRGCHHPGPGLCFRPT